MSVFFYDHVQVSLDNLLSNCDVTQITSEQWRLKYNTEFPLQTGRGTYIPAVNLKCPALFDRQLQRFWKDWSLDPCLFVLTCSETICRMSPGLHVHVCEKASVKSSCQTFSLQRDCGQMTEEKAFSISLSCGTVFIFVNLFKCTKIWCFETVKLSINS